MSRFPKFAKHRGTVSCELRNQRDTTKIMTRVPPVNPKFANGTRGMRVRTPGSGHSCSFAENRLELGGRPADIRNDCWTPLFRANGGAPKGSRESVWDVQLFEIRGHLLVGTAEFLRSAAQV